MLFTIVTTNYDTFIEDAYGDRCIVKVSNEDLSVPEKNRVCIYKIHGDFSHRKRIIISKSDYTKYSNNPNNLIWNEAKGLMSKKAILFIGYSIEDVHVYNYLFEIIKTLKKSKKKNRHAYYVAPNLTKEDKQLLRLKGIIPISKTAKEFLTELDCFLKSQIIPLYKKNEIDKTVLSEYLFEKNISVKMSSPGSSLSDFRPIDHLKPFTTNFNFTLKIPSLDKESLQKIGTTTDKGGLRIPVGNLHDFRWIINDILIMQQSDISYIELLPTDEKIDIRASNANGHIILYPRATCYRNNFTGYDLRFVIKRGLYTIEIDINMSNGKDEIKFSLDFKDIKSDYTGLKEELKELVTLTESEKVIFSFRIEDESVSLLKFDLSSYAQEARKAVIYYSFLKKLVTEKNLGLYHFPTYNHDNLKKALILYSYYFEKSFDASILYHSNITYSTDLSPVPSVSDLTEQFHNKHNAFKIIGEINDFSFGEIRFEIIHNGLVIKNSIKQEVTKEAPEKYKLKVISKPSDYILVYADSDDKIDSILSNTNNILYAEDFEGVSGILN